MIEVEKLGKPAVALVSGRFDDEVTPVEATGGWVYADNIVRGDTTFATKRRSGTTRKPKGS